MTADEQLLHALAGMDLLNADGVSRAARLDHCPDCGQRTLTGLDADRCGLAAKTDPTEIDALGEYLAIRLGIPTYNLTPGYSGKGKRRWELSPRMLPHIEAPRRSAVVAAHRCGIRLPATTQPFPQPTTTPRSARSAVPPF